MRVILLGKNGLLGSEFQRLFLKTGHQLFAFGHKDFDITDFKKTAEKFEEIRPEFIINATGYNKVDQAETEKEICFAVNAYAIENLAKLSKKHDAPLLHFSTDYVFDGSKKEGYLESDFPKPLNVYGESKALSEKFLMANAPKYFLVRTSWLFGKGSQNFVSTILESAKTQSILKVVNDQFGKPTYAKDLANACLRFLNSADYGIYHIVNEEAVNWHEYAKEILLLAGIKKEIMPISSAELSRQAKRPSCSVLLNTKLPRLRPWREALKEHLTSMRL